LLLHITSPASASKHCASTIDLAKTAHHLSSFDSIINSILFLAIYFWRDVQSLPVLGPIFKNKVGPERVLLGKLFRSNKKIAAKGPHRNGVVKLHLTGARMRLRPIAAVLGLVQRRARVL
jgi:hypothetical protein